MEQRKLKVYAKFAKSGNRNRKNPEIRLTGRWLEKWGFKSGCQITIRSLNNGIIFIKDDINFPPTISL